MSASVQRVIHRAGTPANLRPPCPPGNTFAARSTRRCILLRARAGGSFLCVNSPNPRHAPDTRNAMKLSRRVRLRLKALTFVSTEQDFDRGPTESTLVIDMETFDK